jgi:hypothetical protein
MVKQNSETCISKWRLVSQGLRLSLINNSDNNEGWWQACRVQIDPKELSVRGSPMTGANANEKTVVCATPTGTDTWATTANKFPGTSVVKDMLENTTYQSGKLRDIHKHMFTLNPEAEKNLFIKLPESHNQGEDYSNGKPYQDPSFDALYICVKDLLLLNL